MKVAAIQMASGSLISANLLEAEKLISDAVAEGATIAPTSITDGKVDVSVGAYAKSYGGTAHTALHSRSSIYNDPASAVADAVASRDGTLVELIALLGDDWSQTTSLTVSH